MKKLLIITFVIIIAGASLFFWQNTTHKPLSQEEQKQALKNILGREARDARVLAQGEVTYQGKYFSLTHPAYVQVYDKKNPNILDNEKILEHFQFSSEDPKFRFVVLVIKDDAADLDELSAVRTRAQNKSYQKLPITIGGDTGVLFVKESDGVEPAPGEAERSIFFLKNGASYSFVITGVDAVELEKIYGQIIQSLLLLK